MATKIEKVDIPALPIKLQRINSFLKSKGFKEPKRAECPLYNSEAYLWERNQDQIALNFNPNSERVTEVDCFVDGELRQFNCLEDAIIVL